MSGKETLMQYRETEREIAQLERELQEWRSRADRVTTSYSIAPGGSGSGRHMENAVLHLHELALELAGRYREQAAQRLIVGQIIDSVPDLKFRAVLRRRYLDGLTIQQIADDLGYCWHQINKQHMKALSMLEA